MMEQPKRNVLLVDLEYPRSEINEPINVDTILDSLDDYVREHTAVDVWYRTLGDRRPRSPDAYDVVLISTKVGSLAALDELLEIYRDCAVVVGGMLATFAHEALLGQYPHLIVSLGECECNLNAILRGFVERNDSGYVKQKLMTDGVSGVAFIDAEGKLYASPIRPFDLSTVTVPPRHRALVQTLQKNGLVRIEGSRGCPWNKCRFCCVDWRYGDGTWRAFPLSRTVAEIIYLVRAGAKIVYFTDEDFVGNREHFFALFEQIKALKEQRVIGQDIRFWGSTSVYTLTGFGEQGLQDFLSMAHDCNIDVLFLGIESGCDAQLARYSKGVGKQDNLRILRRLRDAGIQVDAGFIMFDAETTLDEVFENLEFCVESGLDKTVSRLAKPLRLIPHTKARWYYGQADLLTGAPDNNELIHPYRFRDEKVQVLFAALTRLDARLLDTANALQAEIRMGHKYGDERFMESLLTYRQYEYTFIRKFIESFAARDVDEAAVEALLAETVAQVLRGHKESV